MDRPPLTLDGKRALVTGGSRGIGAGIVTDLLARGARVVSIDPVEPEAGGSDAAFRWVQGDVAEPADCARAVAEARDGFGGLDVLVNNAGISMPGRLEDPDTANKLDRQLKVNLYGTIYTITAALDLLKANPSGGAIINISSIAAYVVNPVIHPGYACSKGAQIALSRYIAAGYGKYGIRCNAVLPGAVATELWQGLPEVARNLYDELHPLGVGEVRDVASLVSFLASDDARWISGAILVIDGGNLAAGGLAAFAKSVL